jgi:hypothetical protein
MCGFMFYLAIQLLKVDENVNEMILKVIQS